MRKIILFFSILFLWTCGGGGSSPTEPEVPPIVINLTSLDGQAQKGPFNNGTAINIAELTSALSPTGRNFSSAITDNTGRFAVANVQLESPYVELRANGYYFNEVSNEISSGQLTLFALSNLTGKSSLNVNIITHLEKNRMTTLMSGDSPKTFAQAKLQAQEEVFAVFDYSRANVPESELLDISQGGAANGKLLAMSAIIQGDLTVGQMSQLLANISTDIASDGTLDDASLRATLINNSKNLDMAEVRSNLVAHYSSLGISATIPDFETEINQFLKPPVSQDMSASTAEDTAINITLAGSDPEGESLTYTILEVNNATVTLNGNVANYLPDANYNGTDTFTYYANDGTTDSNVATVTMTVSGEDDNPNTQNAAATTDEDVAVVLQLSAEEYDGDSYSFAIINQPSNGAVSLDGVNATYTPNQDFNGTDTFTFEATDDTGRFMNVGTATITVNPVNDLPVLDDATTSASVDEEASVDITITATDVDGDQLSYQFSTSDNNGNQVNPQGNISISGNIFTFTSNPDSELSEGVTTDGQFYYYVVDNSNTINGYGLATVTITGVDDLPHADDKTLTLAENISADVTLSSTDPDGGDNSGIQYEVTQDVSNGSISFASTDVITYTPTTDFHGSDQFKYRVVGDTSEGTVDITVEEVVGTVKTYPDIVAGYDESFSDIVQTTGGYSVVGLAREKGDSGGSTYGMLALTVDSNLNSTSYINSIAGINMFNNGWPNWNQDQRAGGYDINERGLTATSQFAVYSNTFFWVIDETGNAIGNQSADHPPSQTWAFPDDDYQYAQDITSVLQVDDGYIVHIQLWNNIDTSTGCGTSNETYPAVVKTDLQGNFQYYLPIDFEPDASKYMSWTGGGVVNGEESGVYYIIGKSQRCGFTGTHQIRMFRVTDTGSGFTLDQSYNLSDPGGAPTNIQSPDMDSFVMNDASSNILHFSLATQDDGFNGISTWEISSPNNNPSISFVSFSSYWTHDGGYFELAGKEGELYVAETENNDIRVIKFNAVSASMIPVWDKRIDVLGSGYEDTFGGMTVTDNGVAITGRYRETDNDDWNGFILLLDSNGE
tara:strand:+ start:92 stop:3292 length:3201 start_codon:yes stop_codon:yes gene_type:complete